MIENNNFEFIDYFVLIVKWKKFLLSIFLLSLVLSYLYIFFFVPEKFDSTALIIPAEGNDVTGISSVMKSFSNLPISIPGLSGSEGTTDIYTTLIYSRTSIKNLIDKFDLKKEYIKDNIDETIKAVRKDIKADETEKGAYEITVRASSAKKAAYMANYLVEQLNLTLIKLNTAKARENRMFLEKRYEEIKSNLILSQDSLVKFQKKSGLIFAEEQAKSSIEAYAKLESELFAKQIELTVLHKLFGKDAPRSQEAKIAYDEFKTKLEDLKRGKDKSELILPIDNLPQKTMTYLRYFSNIEINKALLEFIIPLYEQSKFEEQKSIPYIQIIDYGVPPVKKSYPQRVLFALLISIIISNLVLIGLILHAKIKNTENDKIRYIVSHFFKFRNSR